MKFQTKLYALAAAGLLGAVIISGVGFWSDRSQSALRDEQAAVADAQIAFNLGDMYHDHLDSLAYRALAAAEADDAAALDSATKEANETIASYEGVYARLAHLGLSAPALRALNSAHPDMRRFFGAARAQLAASRTSAKAAKDHLPTFAAAFDALEAKNEQVAKELERMGAAYTAHADTLGRKVRTVELAVLGLALLLAGAFANRVIAQLTRAVQRARLVATDISHGKLDTQIRVHGDDDIAEMLRALQSMQCTLVSFADAQHQLAREHGSGNIDHRIGAERFDGAYREMATGVNDLLDLNERTLHELLEVIRAYSAGDLSPSMRRLPGAQARVHEAADAVRDQLHSVNEDIRAVVQAGMEGDFSVRGNEEAVDHVYRDMVRALNQLMASSERGLGEVDAVLGALADGDLTRRADAALPGQLGALARNANSTAGQLAQVVAQIHQAAEELNTSTAEIAAGNHDLSERTEQQAAALEETASSMEELTSTVKQNADNASQAAQLAQHAADVARQGGEVVGDVVHTMSAISDSSRRIADIIGVIDGIAFQTNILALNAAVEAARAGEQGRGFAVVAAEVRSLAQRSATAAKEIKQLITVSVERVGEGAALVDRAGATMTGIVDSVQRVTDIVAEIAAASNEQNAGIGQINRAIAAMDEGTQQNTALVEEASASARSLEQQAEQLVHTVSVFRTGTELDGGRRTQASGRGRGTARGRAAVTLVDSGGLPVARIG